MKSILPSKGTFFFIFFICLMFFYWKTKINFIPTGKLFLTEHPYGSGNLVLEVNSLFIYFIFIMGGSFVFGRMLDLTNLCFFLNTQILKLPRKTFLSLIVLLSFSITILISYFVFDLYPRDVDHMARIFQAKTFIQGKISVPTPPEVDAFKVFGLVDFNGRWFSKYFFGQSIYLAIWYKIFNVMWGANPFLGSLNLIFMYYYFIQFKTELFVRYLLILTLCSPFYLFMVASYHSHVMSMTFFMAFILFLSKSGYLFRFISGLSLAIAFSVRPFNAVLMSLPFLLIYFIKNHKKIREFLFFSIGPFLMIGIIFIYHYKLTGSPFVSPFQLFDSSDRPGLDVYGHNLSKAIFNVFGMLRILDLNLLGWPFSLIIMLVGMFSIKNRDEKIFFFSMMLLIVGYATYYWTDYSMGARYYFEAYPFFIYFLLCGLQLMLKFDYKLKIKNIIFFSIFMGYSFNFSIYFPNLIKLYSNHYNGNINLKLDDIIDELSEKSLIFIPSMIGQNRGFSSGFLSNWINLDFISTRDIKEGKDRLNKSSVFIDEKLKIGKVIFAKDRGRFMNKRIYDLFPNRNLYKLYFDFKQNKSKLIELYPDRYFKH